MKRLLILLIAILATIINGCNDEGGGLPSGKQSPEQGHENPQPKTKMPDPDL